MRARLRLFSPILRVTMYWHYLCRTALMQTSQESKVVTEAFPNRHSAAPAAATRLLPVQASGEVRAG
jgi:hypothetical protein